LGRSFPLKGAWIKPWSVVIVGIIRRKPVITHASIVCGGMLALANSVKVNGQGRKAGKEVPQPHAGHFSLL